MIPLRIGEIFFLYLFLFLAVLFVVWMSFEHSHRSKRYEPPVSKGYRVHLHGRPRRARPPLPSLRQLPRMKDHLLAAHRRCVQVEYALRFHRLERGERTLCAGWH